VLATIKDWLTTDWKFDPISGVLAMFFAPAFFAAFLMVRRSAKSGLSYVVNGVLFGLSPILTRSASARLSLKKYSSIQMAGESQYLHIPSYDEIRVNIDDIFVPLIMENVGAQNEIDHQRLLTTGNRMQIIGDPGSGKSTVMKRIFRDQCKLALSRPLKARFPIILELRHLSIPRSVADRNLGTWLLKRISEDIGKINAFDIQTCFDAYLQTNGLLVLLDGLDEVNSENFARIMMAIGGLSEELHRKSPNNIIVLTMRTQFYQQVKQASSVVFPHTLVIRRFTPTDIFVFLQRWPFGNTADRLKERTRIFKDLTARPSLRELCTNPLVLSMYVARDQSQRGSNIAESRTEFYELVTRELLTRRRAAQFETRQVQTALLNQRMLILGKISFIHLVAEKTAPNLIKWSDMIKAVQEIAGREYDAAEHELREISKETGIITEEQRSETGRFIHLTFCEFLAGYYAANSIESGWNDLIERHKTLRVEAEAAARTRLTEVVPFACALLPAHKREGALNALIEIADWRAATTSFLETKLYQSQIWQLFARNRAQQLLLRSTESLDRSWLEEVHLFLVTCKDAEDTSRTISRHDIAFSLDNFFHSLLGRGDKALHILLESYAQHDGVAAFQVADLCHLDLLRESPDLIVRSLDQPACCDLLIERALRVREDRVLIARLQTQAALRSPAASRTLQDADTALFAQECQLWPLDQWYAGDWMPNSLLTRAVTVAVNDPSLEGKNESISQLSCVSLPSRINRRLKFLGRITPIACRAIWVVFPFVYISEQFVPHVPLWSDSVYDGIIYSPFFSLYNSLIFWVLFMIITLCALALQALGTTGYLEIVRRYHDILSMSGSEPNLSNFHKKLANFISKGSTDGLIRDDSTGLLLPQVSGRRISLSARFVIGWKRAGLLSLVTKREQ